MLRLKLTPLPTRDEMIRHRAGEALSTLKREWDQMPGERVDTSAHLHQKQNKRCRKAGR